MLQASESKVADGHGAARLWSGVSEMADAICTTQAWVTADHSDPEQFFDIFVLYKGFVAYIRVTGSTTRRTEA